jgi:hypothetical protein
MLDCKILMKKAQSLVVRVGNTFIVYVLTAAWFNQDQFSMQLSNSVRLYSSYHRKTTLGYQHDI